MRVDQIFENARAAGTMPVSFEMFPPKGELTLERAREVAGGFAELAPDFVSVTYSAGGSGNSAATAKIAQMISDELGLTSVAHLTCISLTPETLGEKIAEFRSAGIENVLALRGDLPDGMSEAEADGITVPITAGIMPFTSKQQVTRMVFTCAASLPAPVIKILARYEDNPASLRAAGIEYACRQLEDLAAHGVDGLHVYTMNRADVAAAAMSALRG